MTTTSKRYTLQQKLGAGGMGDVWEGVDTSLGRRVAIKTIKPELAADPQMFARFRQEAEAAASLGHPNIIQVIELTNDSPPLLVMEMLDGKSLRDLLHEEGRLPPARACFIALQILSALSAAHGARIVHRDIKPGNVYVVKTLAVGDFVKVLDFGIAKLLDRALPDGSSPLTAWGDVLGTTAYMAPEQALGMPVDARADLFAVGAILFEALSGTRAREPGPGGKNDIRDAAFKPCRNLADVAPWVDRRLAAIVDRSLALDPARRIATAEEMAAALSPFAQPTSNPRLEATTRDAPPPAMTAYPTVPRTMTAQPTAPTAVAYAPVAPAPPRPAWGRRLAAPAQSTSPLVYVLVPLALVALAFTGLFGACLALGHRAANQKGEFIRSRPLQPCTAPSECRAPSSMQKDSEVYEDVRYGACVAPPPGPTTPYANGEMVWVMNGPLAEPHKIVEAPDVASYLVQSQYGDSRIVLKGKIVGQICVRADSPSK